MTEREVETVERKDEIVSGKTFLGIEFGSTRIKAVLTDADHTPIASGSHEWENRLDHGIWTYTMDDIWGGLQDCYRDLKKDVKEQYGVTLTKIRAIGFSAMMHGYLAFDKAGELLVPFRTWRNTITEEAAAALTKEFSYNIPQRWSIAHLYQASKQRGACERYRIFHHACRIYPLETDWGKGTRRGGCIRNVPNRQ